MSLVSMRVGSTSSAQVAVPRLAGRRFVQCRATSAYTPPSAVAAATELDAVNRLSELVPDLLYSETTGIRPRAATVSASVLKGISSSPSALGVRPYQNAIFAALAVDTCAGLEGSEKFYCQLDQAIVNVGALMSKEVDGRVATEVDPLLATDTYKIVEKVRKLLKAYASSNVPANKLIFRIPATWEGIRAAGVLESEGVATQAVLVFSLVQAIAAAQAGMSVVQLSVGRVRDWYAKHPGAIRDPKGPRQDGTGSSGVDPGLVLVREAFAYIKKHHPKTKVMAGGLRSKADVLALTGCDYLVVGSSILRDLSNTPTTAGYNDGLSALGSSSGMEPALGPEIVKSMERPQIPPVTASEFQDQLGQAGAALLKAGLDNMRGDANELVAVFNQTVPGKF